MKKRLLIAGAITLLLTIISSSLAFDVGRWGYYWNLASQEAVGDSLDSMLVRLPGLGLYVDGDSLNVRVAKGLIISGDSIYWDSTLSTTVTGIWLFNSNVAMAAKLQANAIFLGDSTVADSIVLTRLTILGFIGDTAVVLRGAALDSALRVWNDSIPGVRAEVIDSIMRVLSDTLPNYANLSEDESITGKWNFSDTTEFTVIALINGADTSWFYTASDTTYWQSNGNDIKIGSSSIVVPSTGPVTITSAIFLNGADLGDTLLVDTARIGTKIRLVESASGTAAFEHLDNTAPQLAVGKTTQTSGSGVHITDGGTDKPGYLDLFNESGTGYYAWIDANGILHVHNSNYGADPEGTGQKLMDADDGHLYGTDFTLTGGGDVASNATFGGAFHEDSTETDSAYVTRNEAQSIAGDSASSNDVYVYALRITSNQTINQSTLTTIIFNSEPQDWGSDYNTTTGVFTAPDSGVYNISSRALIEDNGGADASGYGMIAIYRNDSLKFQGPKIMGCVNPGAGLVDMTAYNNGPDVSASIYCNASDEIKIKGYQTFDTGGGLIVADSTWLTIRKEN